MGDNFACIVYFHRSALRKQRLYTRVGQCNIVKEIADLPALGQDSMPLNHL